MITQFCISNQSETEIFALAKRSEEFVRNNQVTLLVEGGSDFQIYRKPGDGFEEVIRPVMEMKPLVTGYYQLKVFMKEGQVLGFNQHNFVKTDFPVRNFKDNLLLKRVEGESNLVRVYSTDGLEPEGRNPLRAGASPSIAAHATKEFLYSLIGKDNLISDVYAPYKTTIQYRDTKLAKGSFFHSNVYRFNAIGDCTPLKMSEVNSDIPDGIYIRYSFSKNKVFIYHHGLDRQKVIDMLCQLELSGQTQFYLKPEFRVPQEQDAYIEPIIPMKRRTV